ncbi:MAG TPA: AAA family ATPase [Terrimicrobiaceae bacterium]
MKTLRKHTGRRRTWQCGEVEDFLRNPEQRGALRSAVVICDEAGLKSARQGSELLRLAQKQDLRVLLAGDVRPHVSVEAGGFLRVVEAHSKLGRCQVEEIHRQTPDATVLLSRKWLRPMSPRFGST